MKKLFITFILLLIVVTVFAQEAKNAAKISFNDENGTLLIRNNTTVDVVIFAGSINRKIILGGIKSNKTRSFDITKLPSIPKRGTFLIRAVNYETVKNKTYIMDADVIYTGFVTYNLDDKNDINLLIIPSIIDVKQEFRVYVNNESENFILELRIEDPIEGQVVAALPPLQFNQCIYLAPSDNGLVYSFYPTFVYVNTDTGKKTSIPGEKYTEQRAIPRTVAEPAFLIRFGDYSPSSIKYNVAFVSLENNTNSSVEFHNADNVLKTKKGIRFIRPKQTDGYELQSSNGEKGQLYTELSFEFDDFTKIKISDYRFKQGYKYHIVINKMNGNYQYEIHEVGQKTIAEDNRIQLLFEF